MTTASTTMETVTLTGARGVTVRSGQVSRVVMSGLLPARVWIWAPGTIRQAPDRLVLLGTVPGGAPGQPQVVYEEEAVVKTATFTGGLYTVEFPARAPVPGAAFSLVHYPGGGDRGGITLFEGRAADTVFRSDGTRGTSAANLVAVHVHLSDEVAVTASTAGRLRVGRDLPLQPPSVVGDDPLRRSFLAGPTAQTTVAVQDRAWRAGVLANTPADVPPETVAAIEGADTWLHVVHRDLSGESGGPAFAVQRVGSWRVESDGRYQYHVPAEGDAPDAPPEPVGLPSDVVFAVASKVEDATSSLYGFVSPYPLTPARAEALLAELAEGDEPGLTPMGFRTTGGVADGVHPYVLHTDHARWVPDDRVWRWYLPDPLRVTARLTGLARVAAQRYDAWVVAAGPVLGNAGLVAAAAFDPDHGRRHLIDVLDQANTLDPVGAWAGGEHDGGAGVAQPTTDARLDAYRYGLARQAGYLRRRAHVAGARLGVWLASGAVRELSADFVARALGASSEEMSEEEQALAGVVFEGTLATLSTPAGGRLFAWVLDGAGADPDDVESLATALDALNAAEGASVADRLREPTAKFWWTLARRGTRLAPLLFSGLAEFTVGLDMVSGKRVLDGGAAAAQATALFASKLFGEGAGGGKPPIPTSRTVGVAQAPGAAGVTTVHSDWRSVGGTTSSFQAGPVRVALRDVEVGLVESVEPGRRTQVWTVGLERTTELSIAKALDSALNAVNGAFLTISVLDRVQAGEAGAGEVVDAAKVAAELAKMVQMARALGGREMQVLGRSLALAGPVLEMASAAVAFRKEANAQIARGQQRFADPNEAGMVAQTFKFVGGTLLGVAALGTVGLVALPEAAVIAGAGLLFQIGGEVVLWRRNVEARTELIANDPLTPWLRQASVWGPRGVLTADLLALAEPGWERESALPVAAEMFDGPAPTQKAPNRWGRTAQTATFIRAAYTFPTRVEAVMCRDGVRRLVLWVMPEYVPEAGTLAVSASVTTLGGAPAKVKGAVHYVVSGGNYLYTVVSEDDQLPSDSNPWALAVGGASGEVGETFRLPAARDLVARRDPRAIAAGWSPSAAVPRAVGGGGRQGLPVFLGAGWAEVPADLRAAVAGGTPLDAALATMEGWDDDGVLADALGEGPANAEFAAEAGRRARDVAGRLAGYARRATDGATAWGGTRLGVDGLGPVGPGTTVTGAAFFRPARPFDPDPAIPGPTARPDDASFAAFDFAL